MLQVHCVVHFVSAMGYGKAVTRRVMGLSRTEMRVALMNAPCGLPDRKNCSCIRVYV